MGGDRDYHVELAGESGGHCDCCGNETRTIWGYVYRCDFAVAAYFVHWTRGKPEHFPNIDLLIGTWGDDSVSDRKLVAWLFNPSAASFMVIDSSARPTARSSLCREPLSRNQVMSDVQLKDLATQVLDALWLGDPRVQEVRELGRIE